MKRILFLMLLLTAISCHTIHVQEYEETNFKPNKGKVLFSYYLPRVDLVFEVPVTKTTINPGLIAKLTPGDQNTYLDKLKEVYRRKAILKSETKISLNGQVKVKPVSSANTDQRFVVQGQRWWLKEFESKFSLTKDGRLKSGNFTQTDYEVTLTFDALEFVAERATDLLGFTGLKLNKDDDKVLKILGDDSVKSEGAKGLEKELNELIKKEAQRLLDSTLAAPSDPYVKSRVQKLFTELERIDGLLKNLEQDISVKYPKSEFRHEKLLKERQYLLEQLAGSKKTEKYIFIVPFNVDCDLFVKDSTNTDTQTVHLIGWDTTKNAFEGASMKEESGIEYAAKATITWKDKKQGCDIEVETPLFAEAEPIETWGNGRTHAGRRGFYYSVPGRIAVEIEGKPQTSGKDGKTSHALGKVEFLIPQLGHLGALPQNFNMADMTFYEDLGTINTIGPGYKPLFGGDQLDNLVNAYDTLAKQLKPEDEQEETEEEEDAPQVIHVFINPQ